MWFEDMLNGISQADINGIKTRYNALDGTQKKIFDSVLSTTEGIELATDQLLIDDTCLNYIGQLWDLLFPLACCLMVLYFVMHFMNESMLKFREFDIKHVAIMVLKIILSMTFISYGPKIIGGLLGLGNWAINIISQNPLKHAQGLELYNFIIELLNYLEPKNAFELIPDLMTFSILGIVAAIPNAMILFHAYGRRIELVLRGGLSCLAFQDVFEGGTHSNAIKFTKKYAVCILHGFVMVAVCQISAGIGTQDAINSIVQEGGAKMMSNMSSFFSIMMSSFAAVGIIGASKGILNDIFA